MFLHVLNTLELSVDAKKTEKHFLTDKRKRTRTNSESLGIERDYVVGYRTTKNNCPVRTT
jgi:hypothetical protein